MTDLRNQRRMAAEILKCGINRVWMDQDRLDEIAKAVTKDDIRILINGKAIKARAKVSISTGRKNYAIKQKQKGRRHGQGTRKGGKHARQPKKKHWIKTIRPIRKQLKTLRDEKKISPTIYHKYYLKAKGGEFKSKHHLETHMLSDGVIKEAHKK
jgi:large subunit ribosomal protein L19e